jgi:hypothetical protein
MSNSKAESTEPMVNRSLKADRNRKVGVDMQGIVVSRQPVELGLIERDDFFDDLVGWPTWTRVYVKIWVKVRNTEGNNDTSGKTFRLGVYWLT